MSQTLPYKNLKFDNDVPLETILDTPDDADVGYMVELDLSFPPEIHDKLRQYPPCAESVAPPAEWLSDFQKNLAKQQKVRVGKSQKLVAHLHDLKVSYPLSKP